MRLALGSDHAGFDLKNILVAHLRAEGHDVTDLGTHTKDSVDYPDFGKAVAEAVVSGAAVYGVLVCSSGIGITMAANKVAGIRCANVLNEDMAEFTRRHNDANVIAFGAKYVTPDMAKKYLGIFLATAFEGGRHGRRVEKLC
jgi:RpiB/LacA/LacB family sugar-phosphate isomerase